MDPLARMEELIKCHWGRVIRPHIPSGEPLVLTSIRDELLKYVEAVEELKQIAKLVSIAIGSTHPNSAASLKMVLLQFEQTTKN